jgi:hypothetical protein
MPTPSKRGRRPLARDERRSTLLGIRVTAELAQRLAHAARTYDPPISISALAARVLDKHTPAAVK